MRRKLLFAATVSALAFASAWAGARWARVTPIREPESRSAAVQNHAFAAASRAASLVAPRAAIDARILDPDPLVSHDAAARLGQAYLAHHLPAETLAQVVLDERVTTKARVAALTALAKVPGATAIETLRALLSSRNLIDRRNAVGVLGYQRPADATPLLIDALGDADTVVRQVAHDTLERISGRDFGEDQSAWRQFWKG